MIGIVDIGIEKLVVVWWLMGNVDVESWLGNVWQLDIQNKEYEYGSIRIYIEYMYIFKRNVQKQMHTNMIMDPQVRTNYMELLNLTCYI